MKNSMDTQQLLSIVKNWVKTGQLDSIQNYFYQLEIARQERIDMSFVFNQMFINSCNYDHLHIAKWLYELYCEFPVTTKIGLRPSFNYCLARARIRKNKNMVEWLTSIREK